MFWLLVVLIVVYFVHYKQRMKKFVELSKKLPGELPSLPLVGHAHYLAGREEENMDILQTVGRIAIKRNGLASYWIAHKLYIVVADPVAGEVLLKKCLEKDSSMKIMHFFTGNGSIYAPASIWRPRRKLLAPTFNIKKLNHFVEVFASQSALTVNQLRAMAGKGTFPVWKYLTSYTFHSICETTLGVHIHTNEEDTGFVRAFEGIFEELTWRILKPWFHPDWIYRLLPQYKKADNFRRELYDFIDKVIKHKRQEMEEKQLDVDYVPKSDDLGFQSMLEKLLETPLRMEGFSDCQLREEALVMSAAGTDTSAVAASFVLVMLSRHPEVQEKVFEEVHDVLDTPDKTVTAADLLRLNYLEAVVKETLRLYPPVPIIVRTVTTDTELQSGLKIPAGTGILMHIWAMHRNPRYWGPDADVFRPERFLEPLTHPAQFIPFSCGPRNCLGYQYAVMSLKTVLATMLKEYRILPPAEADLKTLKDPIRVKYDIMMKAVDMFQIQLENRSLTNSRII